MRALLLMMMASTVMGCHFGAGPVIALSRRGQIRVGGELSGGAAIVRGSLGATGAPSGGPSRIYATLDPGIGGATGNLLLGSGITLGLSTSDKPGGVGFAGGLWGAVANHPCESSSLPRRVTASIAIGVRSLGGVPELFVTPKLGGLATCDFWGN